MTTKKIMHIWCHSVPELFRGDQIPSGKALSDWFWGETTASKVLFRIRDVCNKSENGLMKILGKVLIVPGDQNHRNKQS